MSLANAQSKPRAVPDEGTLEKVGVAELLAAAWRDRRTGCLRVASARRERRISLQAGAPYAIETKGEPDSLARLLEATRLIDTASRRRVEQFATEHACSAASAVLALKLVEPAALYQALRTEAREQIAETIAWTSGFYQWSPLSSSPPANARPFDVLALLQAQLPKRWGSERLLAAVMSIAPLRGDVAPRLRRVALQLGEAGPMAAQIVSRLDGTATIGRLLGEAAGDPLAAATLWVLVHAGFLREATARSTQSGPSALEFEFEVEATATTDGIGAAAASATPEAPTALDPETQSLRDDIEALYANLVKLDHYAALGLDAEANAGAIKKAYFRAAKRYHPDSLARKGLAGLEEKAARVFGRVSEAFEILSDADKKAAYDRGASAEPEIDTARLAQAEKSFRKGEILLKMGNFLGALEYLVPAVELWPDEPAYRSALGWALYKQPTPEPERAREQLELAHRAAPQDAITMFRFGMVLRALGETETANALIQQARSLESSLTG